MRNLQHDIALSVYEYLDIISLFNVLISARIFRIDSNSMQHVWKFLVIKRWNVRESILRSIGASDWKMAYEIMHLRMKHPKGAYFEKHNVIFGKGHREGVYAWLTLGHTADSRIINGLVEIRICVQNVLNDAVSFDLDRDLFIFLKSDGTLVGSSILRVEKSRVLAFNGKAISTSKNSDSPTYVSTSNLLLGPSDFAVISYRVSCPSDIFNETDFLTRARNALLCYHVQRYSWGGSNPTTNTNNSKEGYVSIPFLDEMSVWEHFMELPGGVVLLNANSTEVF